ncbi:hypothetical protein K456DRAFT_28094 [Colletotrichum gloeosporioides 23]|nr:hypothetical protein K456DRAFT_28094 [Colletotrichum gloeosporioides 23]
MVNLNPRMRFRTRKVSLACACRPMSRRDHPRGGGPKEAGCAEEPAQPPSGRSGAGALGSLRRQRWRWGATQVLVFVTVEGTFVGIASKYCDFPAECDAVLQPMRSVFRAPHQCERSRFGTTDIRVLRVVVSGQRRPNGSVSAKPQPQGRSRRKVRIYEDVPFNAGTKRFRGKKS